MHHHIYVGVIVEYVRDKNFTDDVTGGKNKWSLLWNNWIRNIKITLEFINISLIL